MHFSNCIRVGSLYRSLLGKNRRGKKAPNYSLVRSEITPFGSFSDLLEILKAKSPIKNSQREMYLNINTDTDAHKQQHHIHTLVFQQLFPGGSWKPRVGNLVSQQESLKSPYISQTTLHCKHLYPFIFFTPSPKEMFSVTTDKKFLENKGKLG